MKAEEELRHFLSLPEHKVESQLWVSSAVCIALPIILPRPDQTKDDSWGRSLHAQTTSLVLLFIPALEKRCWNVKQTLLNVDTANMRLALALF